MQRVTNVADSSVQEAALQVRATFGAGNLCDWAAYRIEGPDAEAFLQNRVSNDVKALQPGAGQLNASLDRQAHIEGVFSLHRLSANAFLLLAPKAEAESAIRGILRFKILERFEVVKEEGLSIWTIQGPKSAECLTDLFGELPALKLHAHCQLHLKDTPIRVIARSLTGETGFLLLGPDHVLEPVISALPTNKNGVWMSLEVLDVLRIEAGIPFFGIDYDETMLLPETGLEREAVSYSKGCYLGQETVARIKTYGMVQKALAGLLLEPGSTLPPRDAEILLDGKAVGVVKSGTESSTLNRPIVMAYLGKSVRSPGKTLDLEINGQPYKAHVALLPFYESKLQKNGAELFQEGLKLFSDGYDEQAIMTLEKAIQMEPTLIEAYEALGVILSRYERFTEAIALMNKVLELDPEHVLAHTNLSVFYMKLGNKEKAEEEKAKATMAAFSKKAKEAGLFFDPEAERRKKEAALQERLAMFQEALKYNPQDALGNFGLGSVLMELHRYEEAIAPFEKAIQAQPKHSAAYLSLGKALEGAKQPEQAKEIYQKGIEIAAAKGDLMPLKEMQQRLENL